MNTLNASLIDLNNGLIEKDSTPPIPPAQFYNTKFVMHALHSIANHSMFINFENVNAVNHKVTFGVFPINGFWSITVHIQTSKLHITIAL